VLRYQRVISDYVSELQIIRDNEVAAEKNVEVNHPLHFGGYHFYQHWYDDQAGQYTILMVVSDSGLNIVYAGYFMLCIGVFWHFWMRHLFSTKANGD
jgi:cytochrome c biogenesis protein ResB